MPQYSLLYFEGQCLIKTEQFFASNDEAAVQGSLTKQDGAAAELWQGGRKIKALEPTTSR